jgi:hypothetical protein
LRIVPADLWAAVQSRLNGTRGAHLRREPIGGRPVDGIESKYLLTGMLACATCGGGIAVMSRAYSSRRVHVYGCTSYHQRGAAICRNYQLWPMQQVDRAVLDRLQRDVMNPEVLARAFQKLQDRLVNPPKPDAPDPRRELAKVEQELDHLTAALAQGAALPSVLDAIRAREARKAGLLAAIEMARAERAEALPFDIVERELRRRLQDWRGLLTDEAPKARRILRVLLAGRIVMAPDHETGECRFTGSANLRDAFEGLLQPIEKVPRTGIEPVTPAFSVLCSTN